VQAVPGPLLGQDRGQEVPVEELFRDLDWDDDPPNEGCSPQYFYRSWEHGYGADNGGRTASPVRISAGVRAMPATSAARVHEETAQLAEAAETVAPSQTGRNVPAARKGRLTMSGMSAGAVAAVTKEEERRAALRAYH
jgi:hypothetical protein